VTFFGFFDVSELARAWPIISGISAVKYTKSAVLIDYFAAKLSTTYRRKLLSSMTLAAFISM